MRFVWFENLDLDSIQICAIQANCLFISYSPQKQKSPFAQASQKTLICKHSWLHFVVTINDVPNRNAECQYQFSCFWPFMLSVFLRVFFSLVHLCHHQIWLPAHMKANPHLFSAAQQSSAAQKNCPLAQPSQIHHSSQNATLSAAQQFIAHAQSPALTYSGWGRLLLQVEWVQGEGGGCMREGSRHAQVSKAEKAAAMVSQCGCPKFPSPCLLASCALVDLLCPRVTEILDSFTCLFRIFLFYIVLYNPSSSQMKWRKDPSVSNSFFLISARFYILFSTSIPR